MSSHATLNGITPAQEKTPITPNGSSNGNPLATLSEMDMEKHMINQAHGAAVTSIYNNFKDSYIHATDDKEREAIKERFVRSIQNARKIRSIAISILPKPNDNH